MTAQQLDVLKNSGIEFIDMFYEADDGESIGEDSEGEGGREGSSDMEGGSSENDSEGSFDSENDSEGSVHTSDEEFIDDE